MDSSETIPFASVEGTKYRVVWSCLLLIEHIMSNVACAAHFQTLATNVVGKVTELFRLFNARATQLVLGAGAIHSAARLKSINAKHLALVTQCVGIVLAILPHVRAALMAQLPSKQHTLLVDLDKIKKEYAEHHDKVLNKFVGIIGGIVEHNLVLRISNTNFDERSKLPVVEELNQSTCCPFVDGIFTNTRKMHQVLVSLLPSDDLMNVFSRIFSYLDSKVPKMLIDADSDEKVAFKFPTSIEGKLRLVMEIRVLSKSLNDLPSVRQWDFGAMKFLERKLELPSISKAEEVEDCANGKSANTSGAANETVGTKDFKEQTECADEVNGTSNDGECEHNDQDQTQSSNSQHHHKEDCTNLEQEAHDQNTDDEIIKQHNQLEDSNVTTSTSENNKDVVLDRVDENELPMSNLSADSNVAVEQNDSTLSSKDNEDRLDDKLSADVTELKAIKHTTSEDLQPVKDGLTEYMR